MQDPLGAFYLIRDNFIRYIRTAFCIQNIKIDGERTEKLLDSSSDSPALYRVPWIEPIARYKTEPNNFGDLKLEHIAAAA